MRRASMRQFSVSHLGNVARVSSISLDMDFMSAVPNAPTFIAAFPWKRE